MDIFTQNTKLEQELIIILTWTCIKTKMIPSLLVLRMILLNKLLYTNIWFYLFGTMNFHSILE